MRRWCLNSCFRNRFDNNVTILATDILTGQHITTDIDGWDKLVNIKLTDEEVTKLYQKCAVAMVKNRDAGYKEYLDSHC